MKTVFFVRHAQPNYENHCDQERELTAKGREDARLVTEFFQGREIDLVLSSPYVRARETIRGLAEARGQEITLVDDFRERKVGESWIDDFMEFARRQWEDFSYCLPQGESLSQVQKRNLQALREVFRQRPDCQTIVVGSHGTALSTVIRYYQPEFGYPEFLRLAKMPWIVEFSFDGELCRSIVSHDLFTGISEKLLERGLGAC